MQLGADLVDPKNNMPLAANQHPSPGQVKPLSTDREQSNIPKGGTASTWTYPSPQMFFNGTGTTPPPPPPPKLKSPTSPYHHLLKPLLLYCCNNLLNEVDSAAPTLCSSAAKGEGR